MTGQLQIPAVLHGLIDPAVGEHAKTTGIARAAQNTDESWATACDKAIAVMAARGVVFQAADLIAEGLVDEPEHPNQWGARFTKAAHDGVIVSAGFVQSKRVTVHRSICHQWIGAGQEAAA
ncbi:hypothetical protein [Streptomyces sp. NPDC001404]|uniref:hypothetical protein n=1 Tax=Streptomyces sp. NPDC001404 TaxID=3364571 RepID=UPI0036CB4CC2